MCLLAGQKRLKDEYKDLDMLPKVKMVDVAGMIESSEEYLRSCHGIIRALLPYVIRKIITVQTYGDYPMHVTPDDKMITRMLHITPDKNRLHDKHSAPSVKECTAENEIDNRSVYDILDQICKDTDLHPYVKQHKSKRECKGHF